MSSGQVQAYYIAQPAGGQAVSTLQYPQQQNQRAVVAYTQPQATAYAQPQAMAYAQPQAQQAYTAVQAQPQAYTTTTTAQPQIVYATQQTPGGQQVLAVQPQQLQAVSLQQQQPAQTGFLGADPPEWLKERSEAGPFAASPLVWTALVALLIALILHVVAMSLTLWTTSAGLPQVVIPFYLGLFQYCISSTCTNFYDSNQNTIFGDAIKAEQAMAFLALIIMVICIIIFFIFISRKTNRKPMQMVTIIGSILAAIVLLIIVAVFEANIRRPLDTSVGPAFIVDIVALVVQLLGAGLLIGHYAAITSRL